MQEQDYEEYEEDYTDYSRESGKKAYYIVGYFLLVAILVYPATKLHIGMAGILYAMAGAGVVFGLIWLAIRSIKRKMQAMHLSKGQWMRFLWGYQASPVIEADGHALDGVQEASHATSQFADTDTHNERSVARLHRYEEGELPDRIIEPDGLYLSDSFMPALALLLAAVLLFCGIRRAGKSNGMRVVAEEIGRRGVPLALFDTDDEYGALANRQYLPRGFIAGSPDLLSVNGGHMSHYIAVTAENAEQFGRRILDEGLQVVINLKSYLTDDEAALVMARIAQGMYKWEASKPNGDRFPAFIFVDEATKWFPQNEAEKCVKNKEIFNFLQLVFFSLLVRRGGKQGLGLAVAAQRISELDKRLLQSLWKFLFLQTEQVDIDRYKALGLHQDDIVSLQPGECFIFSPLCIGFRVQMRRGFSPDLGSTPGIDQLHKHHRRLRPVEQLAVHTFTGGPPSNGQHYQEPLTRDDAEVPMPGLAPNTSKQRLLTPVQQAVLEAWNTGYKRHRDIGAYLRTQKKEDVSDGAAYQALIELEALHLITGRQKKATATTDTAEQE